ncbi:hypothetical protein [Pengzhenrongella sicca]|uniref:Uncharacterized protein n=1 Tax=Pengzhenrongella sicca TaxID=2819238 RepID=A0A8A4ZGS9_9MICO|nr:hypothetical protein [Pengzhenrongella sicca]QTE29736.1 hypothetical protein J4E96_01420 [Pengzhenrongella sicca]
MPDTSRTDMHAPKGASAGISAFVTSVLDQLAISAWLPAAMLIGVGTLLVQLHTNLNLDLPAAVNDIASAPWGVLVMLVFGLVLTTMVTQAFSFGVIRVLEGYWGPRIFVDMLTRSRVKRHVRLAQRAKNRVIRLQQQLFESARPRLLREEDSAHVDVWEAEVYQISHEKRRQGDPKIIAEASEIDWREKADPGLAALFYRAFQRQDDYPTRPSRILPTALGNVLRASEEHLRLKGTALERFVMENYDAVPPRLMTQHDQFRDRLDMYSLLVLVFGALAASSLPLLYFPAESQAWLPPVGGCVAMVSLGWLSYRAAIASARGYGSTLRSIRDEVARRARASGSAPTHAATSVATQMPVP